MARPRARFAALATVLALVSTVRTQSPSPASCDFVSESPRYEQVWALVRVTGSTGDALLSDAVLRTAREALGLADCQVSMSAASVCDANTADLACASPTYVCAGYALSSSAYLAVSSGECSDASDADPSPASSPASPGASPSPASSNESALCSQVSRAAREAVASGTCRASCGAVSMLAPPPSPTSSQSSPPPSPVSATTTATYADCAQSMMTVSVQSEDEANEVSDALTGKSMHSALVAGTASFATLDTEVYVFVTSIDVMTGFGSFPPPPPPSPPCVLGEQMVAKG